MSPEKHELVVEEYAMGTEREDKSKGIENIKKFLNVVDDKDLELKGFIENCIIANKLRRIPNSQTIVMGDDSSVLGHTLMETVIYLNNAKNSNTLVELKAQMNYMTGDRDSKKVVESKPKEESSKVKEEVTDTENK